MNNSDSSADTPIGRGCFQYINALINDFLVRRKLHSCPDRNANRSKSRVPPFRDFVRATTYYSETCFDPWGCCKPSNPSWNPALAEETGRYKRTEEYADVTYEEIFTSDMHEQAQTGLDPILDIIKDQRPSRTI